MRLYEELYRSYAGSRCAFFPHGGGYFQGVKSLGGFSESEILLVFKNAKVAVKGEKLEIAKYYDGDMEITGKIFAVEVAQECP